MNVPETFPRTSLGFGAGTLTDMQLMPMLVLQVLAALRAAPDFDTIGQGEMIPSFPKALAETTSCYSAARDCLGESPAIFDNRNASDTIGIESDMAETYQYQGPRDHVQHYLNARLHAFVGFGAGTLTDMQLMPMLVLQAGQNSIMKKLDTIQEKLAKHDAMLSEISDKLGKAERQIQNLNEAVEQHGNEVEELANKVQELQTKNVDLENRSRRANLVFYGVKDDKGETWEQSEELVKDICLSRLAIDLMSVQRAHRIGRFNKKYNRPIIVNFSSDKEKMDVLKNAKKFKGSDYSVDQDYAPETREIRKRLWNYAKTELAESSSKVRLSFDKLIVDGKAFAWDKTKEKVVPALKSDTLLVRLLHLYAT
ncbi:hypothetical protein HPB50_017266 [Hyalomma asiaticum]|uniref:Uncharacterized protein n=1 Tax=Hyalomma asiaticum TaxID=266040 RepID=A0ACB7SZI0_HYAAI|nr:hypothetical protein HPB50_017266 [Hyalomma asiaticum]